MWVIVGVLLGLVVLATLVGFHAGPHSHLVAGIFGLIAAVCLVVMAMTGPASTLVWTLLGADVVVSGGVVLAAWSGLSTQDRHFLPGGVAGLESAEGVALDTLDPDGLVRVRGETWSASSLNGPVLRGTTVQVIRIDGVRLSIWGEATPSLEPRS
jgi:membrane-bound ClpP family serine protease